MRLCVLLVVASCGPTALDEFEYCTLDLVPNPSSAAVGAAVTLLGGPMTELRDTRVEVGGVAADVGEIVREGCGTCDVCREAASCAPCGLCAGIGLERPDRIECFGDALAQPPVPSSCDACVESLTFVVPELEPGPTTVFVINRNGQSLSVPFTVQSGSGQ